ncbi:MAG: hypothetical protein ACR2FM_00805 [Candidatus Saccharimonadales bacterium]
MNPNADKITSLRFNINAQLKEEAQQLADDIGVPLSTVIMVQLKDFVRSRQLTISSLPRLNEALEQEVLRAVEDYDNKKDISRVLRNRSAIASYLRGLR